MPVRTDWYQCARQLAAQTPPNYPEAIRLLKDALHNPSTDRHGLRLARQTLETYHDKMRLADNPESRDEGQLRLEGLRFLEMAQSQFRNGNAFGARTFVGKALLFLTDGDPERSEALALHDLCEKELA